MHSDPNAWVLASGIAQFWLAPVLALVISGVYFTASPKTQPLAMRVLASFHGVATAGIYMVAMGIFWANAAKPSYGTPFVVSLLVPVGLAFLSFFLFRGRKTVHLLQPLGLLCIAWTFFIGGMAVTGNWL